jgi:hypothetical protein
LAAVRCAFVRNLRFAFDAPRCQSRGDGGAVIFKTSASCSAKVRAQFGPASMRVRSRTRMPDNGRSPSGSFSGGLSPIFEIAS